MLHVSRCISRRSSLALSAGVALALLGCATPDVYWTRGNATPEQFERSSQSCTDTANTRVEQEVDDDLLRQGGRTTGPPLDASTDPNAANRERRRERRLRYFYSECMQARGWVPNDQGEGFKGL